MLNAVKYFKEDDTVIIFLGYPKLTPEEAFKNYRKYEKSTDWTTKRTDKELLEFAKVWTNNSKIFEKDCQKYKIRYIDTSYNREEILKKIISELEE